jgi:hypothetical protein
MSTTKKESVTEKFRRLDAEFQAMNEARVAQGKAPVEIDAIGALREVQAEMAEKHK